MKLNIAGPRSLKDPSSVDYAWQTIHYLRTIYQSRESSDKKFEEILGQAKKARIWERIPEEEPYGSLDAMLVAELGDTEAAAVEKVQRRAKEAKTLREPLRPLKGSNRGNNITPIRVRGTDPDYLTARIKRDHREVFNRMKAGEFKSVRQAAIAAGIVKVPTNVEMLQRIWKKATQEMGDKSQLLYGVIWTIPGGYRLKTSVFLDNKIFEGPTEEDCISQAKAAYLEYYSNNPKEQERARQKVVWFEIDLPDTIDATDASSASTGT